MYGISWQNLQMMNATIPPFDSGDGEGGSTKPEPAGMNMWDIMARMSSGKGV